MAELTEDEPLTGFILKNKNYQVYQSCVIMFGIRKEKNGNLVVPSLELYLFLGPNYTIQCTEKAV